MNGVPPRELLDEHATPPPGCWFQIDLLETHPQRPPRIHGWWRPVGSASLDGRCSLYLHHERAADGVRVIVCADDAQHAGRYLHVVGLHGLPRDGWSAHLAPLLALHPYVAHAPASAPGPRPWPRWARAALAYLLTH